MAIKLIANYSKRLGLPGYSSHQFSVSIETELLATDDIPHESARLYHLLQSNVDQQILQTGFVPPTDYGMETTTNSTAANSTGQQGQFSQSGQPTAHTSDTTRWKCSDKQKELILKLVNEHQLDKNEVDALARQRFGKGVRQLSKLEASGLIDELLDTYAAGSRSQGAHPNPRNNGNAYNRHAGRSAA